MAGKRRFTVELLGDDKDLERSLKKSGSAVDDFGDKTKRASRKIDDAAEKAQRSVRDMTEGELKARDATLKLHKAATDLDAAQRHSLRVGQDLKASDEKRERAQIRLGQAEVAHARALHGVQASAAGVGRALDDGEKKTHRLARGFAAVTVSAKGLRGAVGLASSALSTGAFAAVAGLAAVGLALKSVLDEAREASKAGAATAAAIKATGGAAKVTAAHVRNLATAISNKVGVDDEAIQSAENLLLTFRLVRNETGKGNQIFDRASQSIVDMAAAMNGGVVTSEKMRAVTVQVGKALNDPIKGITALARAGVTFTEGQKKQIAALVKSHDLLGAQKIILAELSAEFAGAAAAGTDPIQKLSVVWGNVKETIGTAVLPYVDKLATALADKLPGAAEKAAGWAQKAFGWIEAHRNDILSGLLDVASAAVALIVPLALVTSAAMYLGAGLLYVAGAAAFAKLDFKMGRELFDLGKGLQDSAGKAAKLGDVLTGKANPALKAMRDRLDAAKAAASGAAPAQNAAARAASGLSAASIKGARSVGSITEALHKVPRNTTFRVRGDTSQAKAAIGDIVQRLSVLQNGKTVHVVQIIGDNRVTFGGGSSRAGGRTAYWRGGEVRGGIRGRDSVSAILAPGEVVADTQLTNSMKRFFMPGRTVNNAGGGGGGPVVLEIRSGGSRVDDLLVEILRHAVRVKGGGNVQVALGR